METETSSQTADIVHLNSGGPDLKIVGVDGENVEVEWQGEMTLERAIFPRACVHRIAV